MRTPGSSHPWFGTLGARPAAGARVFAVATLGVAIAVVTSLVGVASRADDPSSPVTAAQVATVPAAPFALVELYTSEGCSSCPPADALLSELVERARRDGVRLFPLSFHVDYWNRLGWRDPWSDAAYSERQAQYEGRFDARYTPQMIVNGADGFVGSDRVHATESIAAALATPARAAIRAQARLDAAGTGLRIEFAMTPVPPHAVVCVALVERGLVSQVERGENRGRRLVHDNVVRVFRSVPLAASGQGGVDVALPADLRGDRASLIVYIQDTRDERVLGAAGLALPIPTNAR